MPSATRLTVSWAAFPVARAACLACCTILAALVCAAAALAVRVAAEEAILGVGIGRGGAFCRVVTWNRAKESCRKRLW